MISSDEEQDTLSDPRKKLLFTNTEEPWSAFICGSQGSGKSHTLSCLLENNLLPHPRVGVLKTPLTGLVFHYDKFANFGNGQVCEAAYLCSALPGGIPVQVLVAPTSLKRMTQQYHNLPGLPEGCTGPNVLPLYFSQEQLSVDTMMTLMAVNDTEKAVPLYISVIRQLLREIAMDNQDTRFNYEDFRQRLACLALTKDQTAPLMLRLQLLQSFLLEADQTEVNQAVFRETWTFKPETLTIIDLSDRFVNETDACALFSICLKLFMADWQSNPRIIALDEAHKFLTASTEATKLTSDLIDIIRQQRHMSARVVVATQEPTVSDTLLDLCNVSIIHRFNSPKWYRTLREHLAGACVDDRDKDSMFRDIVKLSTGEALVFCPTAVLQIASGSAIPLQDGVVKILVRDRISADGGQSVQASSRNAPRRMHPLPAMLEFERFRGDRMPAPGSLAKKLNVNSNNSSSGNGQSTTTSQLLPVSVPKHQRIEHDGARSSDSASSGIILEPDTDQDSDLDSEPRFQSTVVTRSQTSGLGGREAKPQNTLDTEVIAIHKRVIPANHKYCDKGVSEAELLRIMYKVVQLHFKNTKVMKNPEGCFTGWLKNVSQQCGLNKTYLINEQLGSGCRDRKAIDLLKRVVKKYYDDRGIGPKRRAASCTWLTR